MKNMFKISVVAAICCLFILFSPSYGNDNSFDDVDNITEDSSMEAPVELKGLSGVYQVREKEAEYVKAHYPDKGYESVGQGLLYLNKKGRVIHAVLYKNPKGDYLGVFYDINDAVSKIRRNSPKEYKQILKNLKKGGMTSEILN